MQLLEIAKLPTAENSAIQLHSTDNVAVARVPLTPESVLRIEGETVRVREHVPAGHKIALRPIAEGEIVRRYGQNIGRAKMVIEPGQHIHTQNLSYQETAFNYQFPAGDVPFPAPPRDMPTFLGFKREDGRVGTRNYIAVVAASNCAAHTSELIAESFDPSRLPPGIDGIVAFPHGEGCGMSIGPDSQQLQRTLSGVLAHPNIAAAVILGLGCEVNQIEHYLGPNAPRSTRLVGLTVQNSGGTSGAVRAAHREIEHLLEQAAAEKRTEITASKITLGLNCGGSDSFSGITANPALGYTSDLLAAIGATAVLAETTEISARNIYLLSARGTVRLRRSCLAS